MNVPLKRYWALLAQYLKPLRFKVSMLTLLIFSTIALQLVNPQIIRYFIDTAIESAGTANLLGAALLFLLVSLVLQGTTIAATYVGEDVGWQSTNQLRADLARHCLKLDMSFHNEHTPGEMIERLDGNIAEIGIFFAQFVIRICGNLLLLVGVLVVLAFEDWRISAAMGTYIIIALIGLGFLRHIAVPYWKTSRQAHADLFGFLEEQLAGTEDTRSSGAGSYVMRNLFKFNRIRLDKERKAGTMSVLVFGMWMGLYTLGQAVAMISGYIFYGQGILTIGSVYLIIHYTDIIFRPLREITRQIENLQKAAAGIDRVEELYHTESRIQSPSREQKRLATGPLALSFDDVNFSYNSDERILKNLTFQLKPGQILGLLGRTGSGKTTITRLLFRLYDPEHGRICLGPPGDQIDLKGLSLPDLRQRIGIVTQDVQLFQASVRDNLTFFNHSISDDVILNVITDLGLRPWYDSLPQGLDTYLESEGSSLSAGEAQLLAFTRVFLSDPGLVILDEASSRLDPATEQLIERAVDKLLANRTGIIVAHRLKTVRRADQIMIIEGGQIQEFGAYETLAHDPQSRFSHLLQTGLEEVLA